MNNLQLSSSTMKLPNQKHVVWFGSLIFQPIKMQLSTELRFLIVKSTYVSTFNKSFSLTILVYWRSWLIVQTTNLYVELDIYLSSQNAEIPKCNLCHKCAKPAKNMAFPV